MLTIWEGGNNSNVSPVSSSTIVIDSFNPFRNFSRSFTVSFAFVHEGSPHWSYFHVDLLPFSILTPLNSNSFSWYLSDSDLISSSIAFKAFVSDVIPAFKSMAVFIGFSCPDWT